MKRYLPPFLMLLGIIVLWETMVRTFSIRPFILPAPTAIGWALITSHELLLQHSIQTVAEALAGFFLAIIGGTMLSVVIGLLPGVKKTIYPLLVVSQTIPIMALAPLLIIWFGYGILPKIMVVALVCFFPITVSLVEGFETVEEDLVKMLIALGATPWQVFKKIRFPAALPSLFTGLKIAATYSIMGAVIGEWLGASRGLGVYMTRSMHSFLTDRVFASIVVISLLSLLLFSLVEGGSRLLMPWNRQKKTWQE